MGQGSLPMLYGIVVHWPRELAHCASVFTFTGEKLVYSQYSSLRLSIQASEGKAERHGHLSAGGCGSCAMLTQVPKGSVGVQIL